MNKKILGVIGAAVLFASTAPAANAADRVQALTAPVSTHSVVCSIQPRADVIVYKYRLLGDKRQYRRWNETRGYWVDPDWIDL